MKPRNRQAWGKVPPATLEKAVYGNLGAARDDVIVGPGRGLDNAVVSLGGTKVMIITTDPVSAIPRLGARTSAWLSVHLIASDYFTSGNTPEFATFSFNFPREMPALDRESYLRAVGEACRDLGVSIVAGHTGSYPGAGFTVIGAGTMLGFSRKGRYVDPSMSRAGDIVVMTKGAAIEATASLAWSFPAHLTKAAGESVMKKAQRLILSCSVVDDALAARRVGLGPGGVTSMHDATEGGVLGGLEEMAAASGRSFVIEADRIIVPSEVAATCSVFGIDPLTSLSEGTLLTTCDPRAEKELLGSLMECGIKASAIGRVERGNGVHLTRNGRTLQAGRFADGYWDAYVRASSDGLR
jgi:hydrogenase maturation factor